VRFGELKDRIDRDSAVIVDRRAIRTPRPEAGIVGQVQECRTVMTRTALLVTSRLSGSLHELKQRAGQRLRARLLT